MWADEFSGTTVLVTGGGSGIGAETASAFAGAGATVIVSGRRQTPLDETVRSISEAGGTAFALTADMGVTSDVVDLFGRIEAQHGGPDILINNAGLGASGATATDITEEEFDAVFAVNAKGVWLGMREAIPRMIARGGGCIVNVSSKNGIVGGPGSIAYTGAKHAVVGLTRAAAIDHGRQGVRINAICPAAHESEMALAFRDRFTPEEWEARMATAYPATGRMGRLDEVAGAILFLCSPAASNIHGIALPVDGGFTAI
ncbi:SDR family NAD(P)-dependent oxidoreductase [Tropicimonas isoalkanivorans]|uniref:NAD(P)-dependent dehydrogenase, short-chain alcohol dehydrogenase family n=1 Tax=Tropicimonas isoalkanivorans TaxID=441112 RepID=A0A1I1HZG8_9RHOB|nr:SDR family oxidoreductase [Tropicimonas isoalkanivorans]SFC29467.1 NAD(P)-dependent dehydrogenase, short-chain alcohol dehydrogenase family [Tropicimonas isoalkanivorans]